MTSNKNTNIRVTQRDINLLNWINAVGFVSIEQICLRLNVSPKTAYSRIKKLTDNGYLTHERIFWGLPGVYRTTKLGVQLCGSILPPLRKITLGSYHHDIAATKLSLLLANTHNCEYIPERMLRHQNGLNGIGVAGHTPDSVLLKDGKKIALELELNKKGARRRSKIMSHYMKDFSFDEVWYFCSTLEIKNQIQESASQLSFLKTFLVDDYLTIQEKTHGQQC